MHGIALLENALEDVFFHVVRVSRVRGDVLIEDRDLRAALRALEKDPLVPLDAFSLGRAYVLSIEKLMRSLDNFPRSTRDTPFWFRIHVRNDGVFGLVCQDVFRAHDISMVEEEFEGFDVAREIRWQNVRNGLKFVGSTKTNC
jgi:hypothetical protein